jgi:hypothetical protein
VQAIHQRRERHPLIRRDARSGRHAAPVGDRDVT